MLYKKYKALIFISTLFASHSILAKSSNHKPVNKVIHTCKKSDNNRDILACALYHEAGNQGAVGMKMVAEVILNRTQSEYFPPTIKKVVYQPFQFSYLRGDKRITDKNLWLTAQTISNNLLILNKYSPDYRKMVDTTKGSLYFKTAKSKASWAKGKKMLVKYKGHKFYK